MTKITQNKHLLHVKSTNFQFTFAKSSLLMDFQENQEYTQIFVLI
jgi:hypothetical protein